MYFYIADTEHDDHLAHQLSLLPVVSLSLFVSMFSIGKTGSAQCFYCVHLYCTLHLYCTVHLY